MRKLLSSIILAACATAASADIQQDIASGQFDIYKISSVDFDGCEYGKVYRFTGGRKFTCRQYKYQYRYGSMVLLANGSRSYLCTTSRVEDADRGNCHRGSFR